MKKIEDIILENEGLIYGIINKYKNYFELDDLYQASVIGLINAYKNYNPKYKVKFISYAYPYILGEVLKYINNFRSIKLSKNTKLLYSKILAAREILTQKIMKEPTTYELSIFLEIEESLIEETLQANSRVDSLDKIISDDGKNFELYDKLGYYDRRLENYQLLYELEKLSEEERKIIQARYYEDMSQKEVGDVLGMYQMEVSRKEKKILQRLKNNIAA